ncbi:MAG: DNA recombination protein RmuC [Clostridia bacterium]|nr:DNA recombination protein RmuC [Clostridia bacterium]
MYNIIIIALLSLVLVISACALVASVLGIILARKSSSNPSKTDTGSLKNVLDLKIEQVEKSNEYNAKAIGDKIEKLYSEMSKLNEQNSKNYVDMIEKLNSAIEKMNKGTREENEKAIENLNKRFDEFSRTMLEKYNDIDKNVGKALLDLRRENSEKLESIQKVVDEKLQKTIDERLKESFENVVSQIGNVNKAIGEIKGIATDVGSLKNVLTNVKTKGIVGEVILGGIIGEILTKEQYETNFVTKAGSRDPVEFAIKMPSGENDFVYLPIDSKFPLETYYKIKDAIDAGDKVMLDTARKELRAKIKTYAKSIADKYISVPDTTDFGVMFLPIEGLYLEVVESGLFEECQREYKINMAGPTTLCALLNALKQGFNSLAIQKKSADVFKLLEAVKTEFGKFAQVLSKTREHLRKADEDLESLVSTRTNKINQRLKTVGTLSYDEAAEIIDEE